MRGKLRKAVCALLCACVVCCCLPLSALAACPGDPDASGDVTAADARVILRAAVGLETLTGDARLAADVNTDGALTAEDARLALRVAVGLELPAAQAFHNQYDVLRSGNFCAELSVDGEDGSMMTVAAFGDRSWISADMDGVTFSFLTDGGDVYLLDARHRIYAAFDDAALALMGNEAGGVEEILSSAGKFVDLSACGPLSDAKLRQADVVNGVSCTAYLFAQPDGGFAKICMDGSRILSYSRTNARGRITESLRFSSVRAVLPAEPFNAPDTYREIPDLMTFLLIAYSSALGLGEFSETELQEMIEEAVKQ